MPYGEGWTFGCAGQEEDLRRGLEKQRLQVWGLAETENVLEKRRPIQWGGGCLEQKFLTFTRDSLENLIKNPPPNANINTSIKKFHTVTEDSQKSQRTHPVSSSILGLFLLHDGGNVVCSNFQILKSSLGFFIHLYFDFNWPKI